MGSCIFAMHRKPKSIRSICIFEATVLIAFDQFSTNKNNVPHPSSPTCSLEPALGEKDEHHTNRFFDWLLALGLGLVSPRKTSSFRSKSNLSKAGWLAVSLFTLSTINPPSRRRWSTSLADTLLFSASEFWLC
jgi:hypothetical protein